MSGFAGILRLDGAPVGEATISALRAAIRHRGADAETVQRDGNLVMVHALFCTTDDLAPERDPSGAVILVTDLRIDNGSALHRELGMPSASDDDLVRGAYERWGDSCADRLEGDFAFVLWDRRRRKLFAARDAFGVKPLVYCHVPGKLFAFASEVGALLAVPDVPRALDESRIAEFVAFNFADRERTFYREIRRLPGGSTLTFLDMKPSTSVYWHPERIEPLRRRIDDEYAEGYREHFGRAVRARMRVGATSKIGSTLSGGLDSSAIACWARDERARSGAGPLPVFSWIFSDVPEADERYYQKVVVAAGGVTPHTIDSATAGLGPWSDLEKYLAGGPVYATNHYLNGGMARAARGLGIAVLLDGLGGDTTVSRGRARLAELAVSGHALTLVRELRALSRFSNDGLSPARLFLALVGKPLAPAWALRTADLIRRRPNSPDPGLSLLRPELASLNRPVTRPLRSQLTVRADQLSQYMSPFLAEGLEVVDRVMARGGVEGRYPFFDRRLAEYCLSLPADQKLARGFSRIVARRAMQGVLPPEVQWRHDKGKPGLHLIPALRAERHRMDDLFLRDPTVLEPYLRINVLQSTYREFVDGGTSHFMTIIRLWCAAVLGAWLRTIV